MQEIIEIIESTQSLVSVFNKYQTHKAVNLALDELNNILKTARENTCNNDIDLKAFDTIAYNISTALMTLNMACSKIKLSLAENKALAEIELKVLPYRINNATPRFLFK